MNARVKELLEWSAETNRQLPMPAAAIVWWESEGCIVDLITGDVTHDDDHIMPTGEALRIAAMVEATVTA